MPREFQLHGDLPPTEGFQAEVGRESGFKDADDFGVDGWCSVHTKSVRMNQFNVKNLISHCRNIFQEFSCRIHIFFNLKVEDIDRWKFELGPKVFFKADFHFLAIEVCGKIE